MPTKKVAPEAARQVSRNDVSQRNPVPPFEPHKVPPGAPDDWHKLIGRNDLARELGISIMSLHRLMTSGQIQSVKVGGSVKFRRQHIEEFLQRNTRSDTRR